MNLKTLILRYRRFFSIVSFTMVAAVCYLLAFSLRFEFTLLPELRLTFIYTLPLLLVARLFFAYRYKLFHGWWRYAGLSDLVDIFKYNTLSSLSFGLELFMFGQLQQFFRSVLIIDWLANIVFTGGLRFIVRVVRETASQFKYDRQPDRKQVLIMGAGDAGVMLLREMRNNPGLNCLPIGFIDDNERKRDTRIHGLPVLGNQQDIPRIVARHKVDEIVVALPSATVAQLKIIIGQCKKTSARVRIAPPLRDLMNGIAHLNELQDIALEDILHRKPVRLEHPGLKNEIQQQRVMITGAGGSIGSELAWQIAGYGPCRLVLYERGESELYEIEMKIRRKLPQTPIVPVIGDILDRHRLDEVMEEYRPDILYHAAAYKHVPMMEIHPLEAVENNVLGTRNLAQAAIRHGVNKFVFISTDKAVRPTSTMGATKRAGELMLQAYKGTATRFIAVRFGNVLDSRGSVLPLFRKQIAEGGPVTVTHPDIIRYFMTIPEACHLILEAGSIGQGGEIFLLDMGEPVKILNVAENMIRLSGLEPYKDIGIAFTGLRPGEKLYEELFDVWEEELLPTHCQKIMRLKGNHLEPERVISAVNDLEKLVTAHNGKGVIDTLRRIIPSYKEWYRCNSASLDSIIEKNLELNIRYCKREFKGRVLDWERGKSILMSVQSPSDMGIENNHNGHNGNLMVTFYHPPGRRVFRFNTTILDSQNNSHPPLWKINYPVFVEERDDLRAGVPV